MTCRLLPALVMSLILPITIFSIGIPLHQGPRCMLIQGTFDVHNNVSTAHKVGAQIPRNSEQTHRLKVQSHPV